MSSYFQSSSSAGGSPYFGGNAGPAASSGGGHHGVLGLAENLGSDIGRSIVGIPEGIIQTVTHPIRTAEAIGHQYAQTYGPLTHGDVSKFLHNVYEHPLGPALDVATVLSLGAAGLERAGLAPAIAKSIELRGPKAIPGFIQDTRDVLPRTITGGPLQRAVKIQAHHLLNRLPHDFPVLGETTRFGRELEHVPRTKALAERTQLRNYLKATRGFSNAEFAALHIIGRGVHPQDWLRLLRAQGSVEPVMLKVLENPKVNELVDHPTPKLLRAVDAAKALSEHEADTLIGRKLLTPEVASARVLKHVTETNDTLRRLAKHNGESMPLFRPSATIQSEINKLEGLLKAKHVEGRASAVAPYGESAVGGKLGRLYNELSAAKAAETEAKSAPVMLRPVPGERFYVPDVMPGEKMSNADFAKMGGGFGNPKLPGSLKQNKGVLFRTGRLALSPDILSSEYLKTVKYGLFDDIHSELMKHAVRLDLDHLRTTGVPQGWVLLRKKVISESGNPRPQRISASLVRSGETKRGLEDLVGETPEKFSAESIHDAARVHGQYLIVPERLAKNLAGEFKRSNEATRLFLEKPTKVWRALVLGLRVGFLTNNVVGNHLLFALHAAGLDGLRAYLNAVRRVKGANTVKSLLEDKRLPEPLRQQFMDEFFPEQGAQGTFGVSQGVVSKRLNQTKTGRIAQKATLGVAPAVQAVAETNLRRALVEYYIRKDPEWKSIYRAMPRQTRDFEAAARKLLGGNASPEFQRRISMQVNQALGDYLHLGPLATFARDIFPFASWYRAILHISGHLALDTPGRTDLLTKIGQVGVGATQQELGKFFGGEVPGYLQGLVPLGGKNVATTAGINPFQTINQIGSGATALLTGKPGATGRAFANLGPNPILLGLIQNLAGKDLYTGRTLKGGGGLLPQVYEQVASQLPETQLGKAVLGHGKVTKTYGKQTGEEAILQFLGLPAKKLAG